MPHPRGQVYTTRLTNAPEVCTLCGKPVHKGGTMSETITIRVSESEAAIVRRIMSEDGLSRNDAIRRCLWEWHLARERKKAKIAKASNGVDGEIR